MRRPFLIQKNNFGSILKVKKYLNQNEGRDILRRQRLAMVLFSTNGLKNDSQRCNSNNH